MPVMPFFVLHLQTHAAEMNPLSDGGNMTILRDWEKAGLLPPNRVHIAISDKLLHTGALFPVLLKAARYSHAKGFKLKP